MSHTLIVLPDDTAEPILSAINGAKEALNIRMFLFTDTTLIEAVIAAHQRGVKVRVMLNPARRSGESENEEARELLTGAGIEVRDSNPAFDLTHQKSMVIDNGTGFVESLNWEPKDLTVTRDYAVVTTRGHEVAEMVACFDADWDHQEFTPPDVSPLIWCPNNGRRRVAEFIDSTKHSLWLQNERYQDQVIIERLVRAVTRGVKVHILAKPPHSLKPDKLIEGFGGLRICRTWAPRSTRSSTSNSMPRCCSRTASGPSSARSTSRPAASTRGGNWRSRPIVHRPWRGSKKTAAHDWSLSPNLPGPQRRRATG